MKLSAGGFAEIEVVKDGARSGGSCNRSQKITSEEASWCWGFNIREGGNLIEIKRKVK